MLQQIPGGQRFKRGLLPLDRGLLDAHRITLEFGNAVIVPAGYAFVTRTVQQHQEAVSVGRSFLQPFPGHHNAGLSVLHRLHEDILDAPLAGINVLEEIYPVGLP